MKLRVPRASLALAFGAVISCDIGVVHTFYAYPYDVTVGCLKNSEAVDVLDGPAPEGCDELHCWVNPKGEVYVTDKVCGVPYDLVGEVFADVPLDFIERAAGPCKLALIAYKEKEICADTGKGGGGAGGS